MLKYYKCCINGYIDFLQFEDNGFTAIAKGATIKYETMVNEK